MIYHYRLDLFFPIYTSKPLYSLFFQNSAASLLYSVGCPYQVTTIMSDQHHRHWFWQFYVWAWTRMSHISWSRLDRSPRPIQRRSHHRRCHHLSGIACWDTYIYTSKYFRCKHIFICTIKLEKSRDS